LLAFLNLYTIEETLENIKFALINEKGKELAGNGNNSIGDLVPGMLANVNLKNIQVYLSDKVSALFPAYKTKEQQCLIKSIIDWSEKLEANFNKDEALSNFKMFGDRYLDFFEQHWILEFKPTTRIYKIH
jgi:hypothetical protein